LLYTTIAIYFNSQISLPLCEGVGEFLTFGVGARHFTSNSATLLENTTPVQTPTTIDQINYTYVFAKQLTTQTPATAKIEK